MKQQKNFVKIKRKKHPSSMKSRSPILKNTEKPKFPVLAEKIIEMSDIVLEILDARFVQETRNFELEDEVKKRGKKLIYVINKFDLVNPKKIRKEIKSLNPKVFVSCTSRKGGKELREKIKILAESVKNPEDKSLNRISVGIIGYPNTGKSSVINLLVGKPAAGVGSEAGFTKGIQKVKLTDKIILFDSPGVIPSNEYSNSDISALSKHAKLGARSYSQVKDPQIVVSCLIKDFPLEFDKFYGINSNGDAEILIEQLGRKKGFLRKNNEIDEDKTARFILKDWQEGKIKIK